MIVGNYIHDYPEFKINYVGWVPDKLMYDIKAKRESLSLNKIQDIASFEQRKTKTAIWLPVVRKVI